MSHSHNEDIGLCGCCNRPVYRDSAWDEIGGELICDNCRAAYDDEEIRERIE